MAEQLGDVDAGMCVSAFTCAFPHATGKELDVWFGSPICPESTKLAYSLPSFSIYIMRGITRSKLRNTELCEPPNGCDDTVEIGKETDYSNMVY